jgi:hypothetical protein
MRHARHGCASVLSLDEPGKGSRDDRTNRDTRRHEARWKQRRNNATRRHHRTRVCTRPERQPSRPTKSHGLLGRRAATIPTSSYRRSRPGLPAGAPAAPESHTGPVSRCGPTSRRACGSWSASSRRVGGTRTNSALDARRRSDVPFDSCRVFVDRRITTKRRRCPPTAPARCPRWARRCSIVPRS